MGDLAASSEPRRLADFLRENLQEILRHWEAEVRKVGAARNLDWPLLLDHLPEFIEDLAAYVDEVRTGHDIGPPEEHSRIHARSGSRPTSPTRSAGSRSRSPWPRPRCWSYR